MKDAVTAAETAVTYLETGMLLTSLITVDGNTTLTSTGSVTLNATDKLTAVVNVVETTSADWSAAETNAKAYTDTVSAALSTAFNTEIGAEKTRAEGVEQALSTAIDNLSSSLNAAEGDAYVSAYVDGNTVKVEAQDRTKAAIDRVEGSASAWDEVSAKIDTSKVVAAANELSTLALSALSDYNDIDEIISEVEKIKGALVNFTRALEA